MPVVVRTQGATSTRGKLLDVPATAHVHHRFTGGVPSGNLVSNLGSRGSACDAVVTLPATFNWLAPCSVGTCVSNAGAPQGSASIVAPYAPPSLAKVTLAAILRFDRTPGASSGNAYLSPVPGTQFGFQLARGNTTSLDFYYKKSNQAYFILNASQFAYAEGQEHAFVATYDSTVASPSASNPNIMIACDGRKFVTGFDSAPLPLAAGVAGGSTYMSYAAPISDGQLSLIMSEVHEGTVLPAGVDAVTYSGMLLSALKGWS